MSSLVPLLADADWVKLIIFLIFFLGPLLGKLFQAGQPGQQANKQPARPRPIPPPVGGNAGAGRGDAAGPAAGPLEKEIEAFLRQAQRRGEGQPADGPFVGGPMPPRPETNQQRQRPRPDVIEAEIVREPFGEGNVGGMTVEQHVREHIASRPVTAAAQHLGETVGESDERLESRLHETFDHRVGGLRSSEAPAQRIEEGTDSKVWEGSAASNLRHSDSLRRSATEVRRMIRNPENVRQAIMWAEILKRPDERNWD